MIFSTLFFLIPLLILGGLVLAGAALGGRREPDPAGHRPLAVYLMAVNLVALFALVAGAGTLVASIASLIVEDGAGGEECVTDPFGGTVCSDSGEFGQFGGVDSEKQRRSEAIQAALLIAAGIAILRLHSGLTERTVEESSLARRIYSSYLYLISFIALLVAVLSAVAAVYGLLRIIAPGVVAFGSDEAERDAGIKAFTTGLAVGGATYYIFLRHFALANQVRARISRDGPHHS